MTAKKPALARHMGLWSLVLYGVGDMLGAGIYGLVGKAAGQLGNAVWLGFVASMTAAIFTGLSYASLGSRYPRAAGAAYVVHRAFGRTFVSYVIGLAVMASGLTSMATASRVFSGYCQGLGVTLPLEAIVVLFILILTYVNFRGIRESTWLNAVCTTVEATGLLIVILVGASYWGSVNYMEVPSGPGTSGLSLSLVLNGAVLTFFSFVGFEDMINVTEEVKDPERTYPRALVISLIVTTVLYIAISISAVSVMPHAELAKSARPLVDVVVRAAPWFPAPLFGLISLFAVTNTALLNYIMGSRLVYGMAHQKLLPAPLGKVHSGRRTPHVAILTLMVIVLVLALAGDVSALAKATSALLLAVFTVVNAALFVLQGRKSEARGSFEVPRIVPILGLLVCGSLLLNTGAKELKIAGILLAGIVALYFLIRPKGLSESDLGAFD